MENIEVLIVTRSMALQQGLGALLESLPEITGVKAIKDLESACAWIESQHPKIAMLDSVLLRNNTRGALAKFASLSPNTMRVLLVDDVQEVKFVPDFAEAILIKGALPAAVTGIVTSLLSDKGEKHEHHDSNQ